MAIMPLSTLLLRRCVSTVLLSAALIGLLVVGASATPQRRPQFRTEVEVVQIQVSVVDGNGNFVTGLGPEDFRLRVDGKDRSITTVYEVDLRRPAATAVGAVADATPIPPAGWRQWLLFFDAAFNSPRGVREAQRAARQFVAEQINPRDLVGVATFSLVTGVRLLVPLTSDHQQVLAAIGGLGLRQAGRSVDRAGFMSEMIAEGLALDSPEVEGTTASAQLAEADEAIREALAVVNRLEFDQYTGVVEQFTEQLGTVLADLLRTIHGRKHVVFFSKGFDDRVLSGQSLDQFAANSAAMNSNAGLAIALSSGDDRFGSAEVRSALEKTIKQLRAADAVVHTVDASGVGGERDVGLTQGRASGGTFSSRGASHTALAALADGTGGTAIWDTNDLSAALGDLERSTRTFYVVAFPRQDRDGEVLELKIEVTRPGAKVASAPERLAPPPAYAEMNEMQRQAQLAEFISKGIVSSDMIFDVSATPFPGSDRVSRIGLVIEVPWPELEKMAKARGDGRVQLDLFGYVLDEEGAIVDLTNRRVGLNIDQMAASQVAGLPFRFYDLLWARPGNGQVRALVRESKIGRLSAVTKSIVVPEPGSGQLWLSGPVSIDHQHPGLMMRGMDPTAPPPHKANGPVAYPYVISDVDLTPEAAAEASPGSVEQLFVVAHNLARHPFTGQTQSALSVSLQSPGGEKFNLTDIELLGRVLDPQTGATHIVLNVKIPENLPTGMYRLAVAVRDGVSGTEVESGLELWVSADGF